jgi:serine/threonine protein kinase
MSDSVENNATEAMSMPQCDQQASDCERTTDGQPPSASFAIYPPPPTGAPTLIGTSFGDYELLKEVARGGMGVVYKCRQVSLNRVVALKMILDGQLASEEAVQRFYLEARSAAALDHPCIVPIYEIGQCNGRNFFTMAFIEGTTLSSHVRKQGVPAPRDAAALMLGIADAVEYAHRHGVIHRDLKPDNVLLDQQGRPRITDFGLAKSLDNESGLTSAGKIMGTPAYMAPEQAWGKVHLMGPATDVYALGGILYFLLTGRAPFEGNSTMEVLHQVTNQAPTPPRQLMPEVPAELEAICLRCLEKDPANRYQSAGEMVAALRTSCDLGASSLPFGPVSASSLPTLSSPVLPMPLANSQTALDPSIPALAPRRRRMLLLGLVVLAVALGGGGAFLASRLLRSTSPGDLPRTVNPAVFVAPSRHDFDVMVEMPGSMAGEDGERRLVAGRPVSFDVQVERDAYVGLWNIGTDGTITQLFPNKFEQNNLVRAGKKRVVPGGDYKIEAVLSEGLERVWIMASTTPWDVAQGEEEGPYTLFKSPEQQQELERKVRGFRLKPVSKDGPHISEAALRYQVVPAPAAKR